MEGNYRSQTKLMDTSIIINSVMTKKNDDDDDKGKNLMKIKP